MSEENRLTDAIYSGWHTYQKTLIAALQPLSAEQLALRPAPNLRTIDTIVRHIIGARARWFYMGLEEGGDAFKQLGGWDRPGARPRTAAELVDGLERTWTGMQQAIAGWSAEDWARTWPGEDDSEPETITPHWIIWHLIEHDLHHGGEISFTLGMHSLTGINL